jgi:hypothetical protein
MTEKDTVLYTNPIPIPKMQGKKRVLILEGTCGCYIANQELILEPGDKWTPTTHIQKCRECNKEYYLDWTETERTYL